MTTHLTAISGKDGEVLLKIENPFEEYQVNVIGDSTWKKNTEWKDFERENPGYPTHGFTLKPGERVEADSVELVWQGRLKLQYCRTPIDHKWHVVSDLSYDNHRKDSEINTSSAIETRQAFIPVTPKPPQQKDVALLDKEQGEWEKPEWILCAAIHFDDGKDYLYQPNNIKSGLVLCGHRHGVIFQQIGGLVSERQQLGIYEREQGFLTSKNYFVSRENAAIIAFEAGQITKKIKTLYSEDLY